ncbi:MAG: formylglycine-generating enzyme family protein, partial [Nitrospinae bacterium]|nr:formylglycine-generating enzyme family protein [Nitrospinota bacterium]
GKRLPTEWEWEWAARGERKPDFPKAEHYGWFKDNSQKQTHPVGQKIPNAHGLYDMAGKVWEWTSSDHESGGKVLRGGSWRNSADSMRSSKRIMSLPIYRFHYVGFRCAASAKTGP